MTVECPAPECSREFDSEAGKNGHLGQSHPSLCGQTHECENCGEGFAGRSGNRPNRFCSRRCYGKYKSSRTPAVHIIAPGRYETWDVERTTVSVHSLIVIANGADPYKVFGNDQYNIDHDNGCKIDNRPENLNLIDVTSHGRKDGRKKKYTYTHKEMLEFADSVVSSVDMNIEDVVEIIENGYSSN